MVEGASERRILVWHCRVQLAAEVRSMKRSASAGPKGLLGFGAIPGWDVLAPRVLNGTPAGRSAL